MTPSRVAALCATAAVAMCAILLGGSLAEARPTRSLPATVAADTSSSAGLGTSVMLDGTTYTIDGGTLKGHNLFESFSEFSLAAQDRAIWTYSATGAGHVTNVINRITGGQPSAIFGKLETRDLPNAAFYFINPAGILFGKGAQVDIPGATYFSTASDLRFKNGSVLSAKTPEGSTLTVSAPASFGFLGGEGSIKIAGVGTQFATDRARLSFSGSNVAVADSTFVAGSLSLVAIGDAAGKLPLLNSVGPDKRGGRLFVYNSQLQTLGSASADGAIDLAGGDVELHGSTVTTDPASRRGGDIDVVANRLSLVATAQANAALAASTDSTHGSGNVNVRADRVIVKGGAPRGASDGFTGIGTSTGASGPAGNITLTANDSVAVEEHGQIQSTSGQGDPKQPRLGRTGTVVIRAKRVSIAHGGISAASYGDGAAGNVRIHAGGLVVNHGVISTSSRNKASGKAGDLRLAVIGDVLLEHVTRVDSDNDEKTGDGSGGEVSIRAGKLSIESEASINADSFGTGAAGDILVHAGRLTIDTGRKKRPAPNQLTGIKSDAYGSGAAGRIRVSVNGAVTLRRHGQIESVSHATGAAGTVEIRAASLTVSDAGVTATAYAAGKAGDVHLVAGRMTVDGGVISTSTHPSATGQGGALTIKVADNLLLTRGSDVDSDTHDKKGAETDAGTISIFADHLGIFSGSSVNSGSFGAGDAGAITIRAHSFGVYGAGANASPFTGVQSDTYFAGRGGRVRVEVATQLSVVGGGAIETTSRRLARSGNVFVRAGQLLLDGEGTISSANTGAGAAGGISVQASRLTIDNGGQLTTSSGPGPAGDIRISVEDEGVVLIEGARSNTSITTNSRDDNKGGRIILEGASAVVLDGGKLEALGSGNAALISISSPIIESTDRLNEIAVAGALDLSNGVIDVAKFVTNRDLTFLDASAVLRGRCSEQEASGETSQYAATVVGPYAAPTSAAALSERSPAAAKFASASKPAARFGTCPRGG